MAENLPDRFNGVTLREVISCPLALWEPVVVPGETTPCPRWSVVGARTQVEVGKAAGTPCNPKVASTPYAPTAPSPPPPPPSPEPLDPQQSYSSFREATTTSSGTQLDIVIKRLSSYLMDAQGVVVRAFCALSHGPKRSPSGPRAGSRMDSVPSCTIADSSAADWSVTGAIRGAQYLDATRCSRVFRARPRVIEDFAPDP